MIPLLTDAGYRVIVPDLIGFGRSDKPADWMAHTFQRHVDWLAATVAALNIQGATAFMFDWGGYFGLPVAVAEPERFARLILNTTTVPRGNSLPGFIWVNWWRRYILKPEIFPISGMVADMTSRELDADTLTGLDAPYPDESYKGGPRRMPMMIPGTFLHPANAPNAKVWEKLGNWNKPTMTLISQQLATQGFNPTVFHEQIPGTAGQPHEIYQNTWLFPDRRKPRTACCKDDRVYRAVLTRSAPDPGDRFVPLLHREVFDIGFGDRINDLRIDTHPSSVTDNGHSLHRGHDAAQVLQLIDDHGTTRTRNG